jgi:tripartite-type tricarboxylate transporter receptor subunit TctC
MRKAIFIALLSMVPLASAQTFPSGPVRMLIGYPPGGSADFTARVVAEEMAKDLGVAVIVENRPGAGTTIASDAVAKARPDGQTVLLNWHQAIPKALLGGKLAYDPDKSFIPVSRVATGTTVLVVHGSVKADSLKELLALAAFEQAAGVKFTIVQYKGGGPATQSVLAGDTQVLFATSPSVMGFIKAGRLKPLVVAMRKGSPAIPGIPGSEEAGLASFESTFWFGIFAPAGTPAPVVARLHKATAASLARPELRAKVESQGMDATPSASPQAFAAEVTEEAPRLERLVQNLGAKVE